MAEDPKYSGGDFANSHDEKKEANKAHREMTGTLENELVKFRFERIGAPVNEREPRDIRLGEEKKRPDRPKCEGPLAKRTDEAKKKVSRKARENEDKYG